MPWFPALRYSVAEREVLLPAAAREVIDWLTDQERAARAWMERMESNPSVQGPRVTRLPDGGLRFDVAIRQDEDWVHRYRGEDGATWSAGFTRIHRMVVLHRGKVRLSYAMKEQVTLEPQQGGTAVTVRILARRTGMSLLRATWGDPPPSTSRLIEGQLALHADARVTELAERFPVAETRAEAT